MKLTILDGHAVNPGDLNWNKFTELAEISVYDRTPKELLKNRIGDSDAIFLNKIEITEELLQECPNLKYIGVLATGYNVIDLEATKRHNITVTNIPAYSTNSVAQHVFSFILNFTNKVAQHNESVHHGDWIRSPDFCYWNDSLQELNGKILGVYGYGNIGQRVALLARAFGMRVICCTRTQKENMPQRVTFENLLKYSDFVTLHTPLTEETKGIINKDTLKLMKKTAFLINTARGGLINEQDVARSLNSDELAGYAADVVIDEPMKADNPLLGAKNCVITPHIAWAPLETRQRLQNIAFENLKKWMEGNPQNVVTL